MWWVKEICLWWTDQEIGIFSGILQHIRHFRFLYEPKNVATWYCDVITSSDLCNIFLCSGVKTTDTLTVTLASSVLTMQRTHSHRGKWTTLCILPHRTKQGNWSADENTQPGSLNMNPNETRRVIAEGYQLTALSLTNLSSGPHETDLQHLNNTRIWLFVDYLTTLLVRLVCRIHRNEN